MTLFLNSFPLYEKITSEYLSPLWRNSLSNFFSILNEKFLVWQVVIFPQKMEITNGYFANGLGQVQLTLPLTVNVGDVVRLSAVNAAGWKVIQNPGDTIQWLANTTTAGIGGSLASTAKGDAVELIAERVSTSGNNWIAVSYVGTLSVV